MDNRPIGVFDSGFGGLTAVRVLRRLLPEEDILFFADNGRAPYGSRPAEQLRRMARQDLALVASHGCKAIIAACGTLSSTAGDLLRACPIPTIGVLDAAAAGVRDENGSGPVGVIATEASIRSGAFETALKAACPDRPVITAACPAFVTLIESGRCDREDQELRAAVAAYLRPLKERGITTLLLGCTHFGLIAPALSDYLGEDVSLIEASACAARQMKAYLTQNGLTGGGGRLRCLTSGPIESFMKLAPLFLGETAAPETEAVAPMEVEA